MMDLWRSLRKSLLNMTDNMTDKDFYGLARRAVSQCSFIIYCVIKHLIMCVTEKNVPYSLYLWQKYKNLLCFSKPSSSTLNLTWNLTFLLPITFIPCKCYLYYTKFQFFCLFWIAKSAMKICHMCYSVDEKASDWKHFWCFCLSFKFEFHHDIFRNLILFSKGCKEET